jgi:hypothetical protein
MRIAGLNRLAMPLAYSKGRIVESIKMFKAIKSHEKM